MRHAIGYTTVFVAGFAACAAAVHFTGVYRPVRASASAPGISQAAPTAPAAASIFRPSPSGLPTVADAVARVEPSVVNIDIEGMRQVRGPAAFFRPGLSEPFAGNGSGIIVSGDGYVVTNNHVIAPVADREGQIVIRLSSGKEYDNVSIVGRDPHTDLAVLKIHGVDSLPTAEFGDSDSLRVGDWTIAIGNPLGFNSSVTLGIVSALNRRNFRNDSDALERVIQTDAAINPGNSGGALADAEGRVIGINTAIASGNGGNVGIGFAIPINAARGVVDQLIRQGRVARPYLGIVYRMLEEGDTAAEQSEQKGAVIVDSGDGMAVRPGSPAHRAGLQVDDIIVAIDGKVVDTDFVIKEQVQSHTIGETVTLTVRRGDETLEIPVTLEEMPEQYNLRHFGE